MPPVSVIFGHEGFIVRAPTYLKLANNLVGQADIKLRIVWKHSYNFSLQRPGISDKECYL